MPEKIYRILVINPGSTSTKVSLFDNETLVFERSLFHDADVLLQYPHVNNQTPFRYRVIMDMLQEEGVAPESIDAFVGRGGSACTQPGGITTVDQKLYDDTEAAVGDARLTGIRGIYRVSHSHVLNQKAVAAYHAKEVLGGKYEEYNFIVAHIDGGIKVSAHEHGRMIDGNMGADGEGAFTPTRIGSVPVLALLDYIEENGVDEVRLRCSRKGGFVDLFGTANSDTIHALVEQGDRKASLVWNTMIYQICKMIGEQSAVLKGKVDGILLTGGLMRFSDIMEGIKDRCSWIAPISVYPGEMEQEALAMPTLQVLRGEVTPLRYTGKNVWDGFPGVEF